MIEHNVASISPDEIDEPVPMEGLSSRTASLAATSLSVSGHGV